MTTFATTQHTTSAATEAWDALTHQLDLVDALTATRDAWVSEGRSQDECDDAHRALVHARDKVAGLNAAYERSLGL